MSLLEWIFGRSSHEEYRRKAAEKQKRLEDAQYDVFKVRPSRDSSPLNTLPRSPLHEARLKAKGAQELQIPSVTTKEFKIPITCRVCGELQFVSRVTITKSLDTPSDVEETIQYTRTMKCDGCGSTILTSEQVRI